MSKPKLKKIKILNDKKFSKDKQYLIKLNEKWIITRFSSNNFGLLEFRCYDEDGEYCIYGDDHDVKELYEIE